jgi:hypothetical protein
MIQKHAFDELTEVLAKHAEYVERIAGMTQAHAKPVTLRTFAKRAGGLYVEAKLNSDAMQHLRQDDPFLLDFKDANALVTGSALLQVHQIDPAKEVVWFRVQNFVGNEMEHIDALAEKQEVSAKGYTARPICDLTRYADMDLSNLSTAIRTMTNELLRLRK